MRRTGWAISMAEATSDNYMVCGMPRLTVRDERSKGSLADVSIGTPRKRKKKCDCEGRRCGAEAERELGSNGLGYLG